MPSLQAGRKWPSGEHSTETLSTQCPFLNTRNLLFLPFRELNIGLATKRRSSKTQEDDLWMISFSSVDCFCFDFCCSENKGTVCVQHMFLFMENALCGAWSINQFLEEELEHLSSVEFLWAKCLVARCQWCLQKESLKKQGKATALYAVLYVQHLPSADCHALHEVSALPFPFHRKDSNVKKGKGKSTTHSGLIPK